MAWRALTFRSTSNRSLVRNKVMTFMTDDPGISKIYVRLSTIRERHVCTEVLGSKSWSLPNANAGAVIDEIVEYVARDQVSVLMRATP